MEIATETLKGFGRLFYIVSPNETSFRTVEDLPEPDYFTKAIPYFLTLLFLENLILWAKNKPRIRLNDGITSLANGMFLGCGQLVVRGIDSYVYIKIYDNWRLCELPWDSPFTWYAGALLTDFGYYWFHRAAHEINLFWSQHQVHHSSEDYNLTTALRQSTFQGWIGWIFYLPLAFFIPPQVYLIHHQFNILFQFWIHTEIVESLGPLEYVLNTPKHHQIHHGSNRYCLDKNYAGVLIIWDRMFGTFAETKPGEPIVYGLVDPVNSFNPFYLQFFYIGKIKDKMFEMTHWKDKLSAALKGPGWFPGKPRLGDINDVQEVPDRKKYNVKLPLWQNIYAFLHFIVILGGFDALSRHYMFLNQWNVTLSVSFIIYALTSIGFLLDGRKTGAFMEILRCAAALCIPSYFTISPFAVKLIYEFFTLSIGLMMLLLFFTDSCAISPENIKPDTLEANANGNFSKAREMMHVNGNGSIKSENENVKKVKKYK